MKTMNQLLKTSSLVIAMSLALSSQSLAGETWVLDLGKSNTKVDFHADGKIMKVHGENAKASGSLLIKDGKVSGQAIVDLRSLTTGISLRDNHMKDKYLEVKKFPKAILEIVEIKLPATLPSGSFEAAFTGKLTVHGVAKAVSGKAKLTKDGTNLKGEVEFATTISGHKIELPKYSGIVLKDDVKVIVEFNGQMGQKIEGNKVSQK